MAALDQNAGTTTSTASNMDKTKDIYPLVIDIAPKVRKPYTVTRQREKWTEDEHRRFLEAVKLYGRGWRQIEEHVGTKTAVQIRSHAQKFFAKFARGFNGDPGGSESPIGIPPPRPKRKPIHPYPRKTLLVKLTSNSYPPERSPSPNCSSMEKETSSPTSVLSATCSEGQQSGSLSPTSCTTVLPNISSNEAGRLNSAREGDDLGIMCLTWTRRKLPSTICDLKPKDLSSRDGVTGANAPIVIKLFGRTVMVAEHEKPLPHDTNMGKENSATEDDTKLDEPSSMNEDQVTQLSLGQIYNSPVHLSSAQLSSDVPQCWQMYQSPPFIYLAPSNPPPLWGLTSEKEKSSSGSRAMIFTGEAETRDTVGDSIDSKCETKPCKARNSQRGFVPCKRCAVEGD